MVHQQTHLFLLLTPFLKIDLLLQVADITNYLLPPIQRSWIRTHIMGVHYLVRLTLLTSQVNMKKPVKDYDVGKKLNPVCDVGTTNLPKKD